MPIGSLNFPVPVLAVPVTSQQCDDYGHTRESNTKRHALGGTYCVLPKSGLLRRGIQFMNLEKIIKELEEIEAEWNANACTEKIGGNVVKEATYKGTATGVRIAINIINAYEAKEFT